MANSQKTSIFAPHIERKKRSTTVHSGSLFAYQQQPRFNAVANMALSYQTSYNLPGAPIQPLPILQTYFDTEGGSTYFDVENGSTYFLES